MADIPNECPKCGSYLKWQEVIDPYTSGIPLSIYLPFSFAKHIRIHSVAVKGLFAETIKEKFGYYKVKYRCRDCGFEGTYDLPR